MKKLATIIILSAFLFSSCDQIIETIEETTESIINYFVDIEPSRITGTENTQFTFRANTNDIVESWIIDGAIILAENARTATDLSYSFSSGSHTIEVLTNNGATDEVEIVVQSVETVFSISAITGENTTSIFLDFPLLTIDDTEYNIETTNELSISSTESQNIVNLSIIVDHTDSFCFINNNAMDVYEIDLQAVTIEQLLFLFGLWYPERFEDPEPEIPYFSSTVFSLSGHSEAASDSITIFDEYATIASVDHMYVDNAVYNGEIRTVVLSIGYDSSDSFLFINGNMYNFFGISFDDMSYSELIIAAGILNRYPEEWILDLQEEYNQ